MSGFTRPHVPPEVEGEPRWRVVASWLWPLLQGPQVAPALVCWEKMEHIVGFNLHSAKCHERLHLIQGLSTWSLPLWRSLFLFLFCFRQDLGSRGRQRFLRRGCQLACRCWDLLRLQLWDSRRGRGRRYLGKDIMWLMWGWRLSLRLHGLGWWLRLGWLLLVHGSLFLQWWTAGWGLKSQRWASAGWGRGIRWLLLFTESTTQWVKFFILFIHHSFLFLLIGILPFLLLIDLTILFIIECTFFTSIFVILPIITVDTLRLIWIPTRWVFTIANGGMAGMVGVILVVELSGTSEALTILWAKLLTELGAAAAQLTRGGIATTAGGAVGVKSC